MMEATNPLYNFVFWAKRLLNEEAAAQNCGDHCRNSCRWCGLRNALAEAELPRAERPQLSAERVRELKNIELGKELAKFVLLASITAFLLLNEWTERDWLRWFCTAAWFSFGITATLWCCNRWL
jgi:hypothetical protein